MFSFFAVIIIRRGIEVVFRVGLNSAQKLRCIKIKEKFM